MITFGFRNKFSGWARAAIAILIGCLMVASPGSSVNLLIYIIASIMIASGIVSLVYGIANRRNGGLGLLIFNTVVDILIGVMLFVFPEAVASILVILIGAALLVFGIFQIAAMISAAAYVPVGPWSFVLSVICAGGGVLLLFRPFKAVETMMLVAGIAVIFYGVSELFATWKMHRAMREYEIKYPSSSGEKGGTAYADVKDAEFEKVDEERK